MSGGLLKERRSSPRRRPTLCAAVGLGTPNFTGSQRARQVHTFSSLLPSLSLFLFLFLFLFCFVLFCFVLVFLFSLLLFPVLGSHLLADVTVRLQIGRAGRWDSGSLVKAYLTGLPSKFLRVAAGFPATQGSYYLRRASFQPPPGLLKQIWPWIEEWEERFAQRSRRKKWEAGGLDEDDIAGQ